MGCFPRRPGWPRMNWEQSASSLPRVHLRFRECHLHWRTYLSWSLPSPLALFLGSCLSCLAALSVCCLLSRLPLAAESVGTASPTFSLRGWQSVGLPGLTLSALPSGTASAVGSSTRGSGSLCSWPQPGGGVEKGQGGRALGPFLGGGKCKAHQGHWGLTR